MTLLNILSIYVKQFSVIIILTKVAISILCSILCKVFEDTVSGAGKELKLLT